MNPVAGILLIIAGLVLVIAVTIAILRKVFRINDIVGELISIRKALTKETKP